MELLFLILLVALGALFVSNSRLKERVGILERRLDDLVEPGGLEIVAGSGDYETTW